MTLRTGHDYHLAEVMKTPTREWVAVCRACNWRGAHRATKGAAEDDAAAHDNAENP